MSRTDLEGASSAHPPASCGDPAALAEALGACAAGGPASTVSAVESIARALGTLLSDLDVVSLSPVEAQGMVAVLCRLERQVAAGVARSAVVAASVTLRQKGGDRAAAEWLGRRSGQRRRDAAVALQLASHIDETPVVLEAWKAGELTIEQADLCVSAARIAPEREDELVELARRAPVEDLRREYKRMRREDRSESAEERAERHHRDRSLSMWTNEDDAFEGRFVTGTVQGASIGTVIELCTEAVFRRARRLGERHSIAAYRIDGLALMAELATGAHPADLGFHLADLPAALRPPAGEIHPADWPDVQPDQTRAPGDGAEDPGANRARPEDGSSDGSERGGVGIRGREQSHGARSPEPARSGAGGARHDDDSGGSSGGAGHDPPSSELPTRPPERRYRPRGTGPPSLVVVAELPAPDDHAAGDQPKVEVPGYGPVPVAWALEHLGDALLRIVIRDGSDVRTVCHSRRANARQLTALLVNGRECRAAGCSTRVGLQVDHDQPWADTHETWLPNLKTVCSYHHDRKTNHRWDWVVEPADPVTGKHRLVPPGHPEHPASTGAAKPRPAPGYQAA